MTTFQKRPNRNNLVESGREVAFEIPQLLTAVAGCTMDAMNSFVTVMVGVALLGLTCPCYAMERELGEFLAAPATLALTIYQKFMRPLKAGVCPMEPSDSSYARQAIRERGILIGGLMVADRLHRCGHDQEVYPVVRTSRGLKFSDPVSPSEGSE